jgi:hypothetical protein
MTEKVVEIGNWIRLRIKPEIFLVLLVFFIPFHQRFYKFLQTISRSFVNPSWQVPEYFEIHLDTFLSDFLLIGLIVWCLKKGYLQWSSFWKGERKYLTLFLFFALVSIINSNFASYPLLYWRWIHLALPAFLFFFLSRINLEKGIFKRLANIVLVTALIECAIATAQYFIQHSLGLKGLGEPTLIARHFLGSHFPMTDGSIWIFDRFFYGLREQAFVLRASGTLPHPNVLGGFMVFSLLMTYHLYGLSQKKKWMSLAILLQTFVLFITYSRSAIFAAVFTMLIWVTLTSWREKKLSSLLWVSCGSFLLSLGLLYPQIFQRGGIVSSTIVSQSSDALRMTVHDVGLAMFQAHPFLGVGFNNYMMAFQTFTHGQILPATHIHNVYLHLGVEVGLFGICSFLFFSFLVAYKGWKRRHQPEVLTCLCIFVGFLAIGLVDFYPLSLQQTRLIFFLIAGFLSLSPRSIACSSQ